MLGLVGFALTCASSSTQAVTMTFDELAPSQGSASVNIGNSYSFSNFTVTGTASYPTPYSGFYVFPENSQNWTGSAGLAYSGVSAAIKLTENNGALFNVESIDISRGDSNSGLIPVGFVGTKADGTRVSQVYWFKDTVHGRNERLVFSSDFRALKSLSWWQGAEWHQFDNLTVTAVPEPQTYALMLAGLGLIAGAAKRRRKQQ